MRERNQIADWLFEHVATALDVDPASVPSDVAFTDLGLSSLQAVELSDDLQRWTRVTLPPTLAFDHPTIDGAAAFVADEVLRSGGKLAPLREGTEARR